MYSLSTMDLALFMGIHTTCDTFNNLYSEILVLLGYNLDKQAKVVKKIKTFIVRIAHRAFADMLKIH